MFPGGGQQGCRQGTDKGGVSHDQDRGVRGPLRCYKCLERGHVRSNCTDTDRSDVCYRCGEPGHVARFCRAQLKCAETKFPQNHRQNIGRLHKKTRKSRRCAKTSAHLSRPLLGNTLRPPPTRTEKASGKREGVFDPPPAIKGEFEMEVDPPIRSRQR